MRFGDDTVGVSYSDGDKRKFTEVESGSWQLGKGIRQFLFLPLFYTKPRVGTELLLIHSVLNNFPHPRTDFPW